MPLICNDRNMVFTQHLLLGLIAEEKQHHMGVAEEAFEIQLASVRPLHEVDSIEESKSVILLLRIKTLLRQPKSLESHL
ncbi:hypothetical protein COP2_014295 [Malus domestica]